MRDAVPGAHDPAAAGGSAPVPSAPPAPVHGRSQPEHPAGGATPPPDAGAAVTAANGPASTRWRVAPGVPGLKAAGAVAVGLLGVLFGEDAVRLGLAGLVVLALTGWAARDLIAPVRVSADADGITVLVGYAARRLIPWERIERIRVDDRSRLGLRSQTLEIDVGDTLHLFSGYDLGAPPAEVAASLERLRLTRSAPPSEPR